MKGKTPGKKMPMHPMPGTGHMMKDSEMKKGMPHKKMPMKKGKH